eukprot:scaffold27147_cov160-Amphora_coffeaeformis.AAC.2
MQLLDCCPVCSPRLVWTESTHALQRNATRLLRMKHSSKYHETIHRKERLTMGMDFIVEEELKSGSASGCGMLVQHRLTQRRLALLSLIPLCLIAFARESSSPDTFTIDIKERTPVIQTPVDDGTLASASSAQKTLSTLSPYIVEGRIPFQERPLLPPLETLETYVSQHSEESLWRDFESNNTEHRRFAIVHYSCPQQLGNRLHHFYNDFLLAFLTNRTILWKYWDRDACIQLGNKYDHEICVDGNRTLSIDDPAQACGSIISPAPWMPRYEDWSKRLNLQKPVQVWIRPINPHNAPHPTPEGVERIRWVVDETRQGSNQTDIGVSSKWKIAVFQPLVGVLGPSFVEKQLTHNPHQLSHVQALFAFGAEFWYGLLFDYAFRLDADFLSTVQPSIALLNDVDPTLSALSIALHSRHTDPLDDGANITEELKCLKSSIREMVLLNLTSCRIFMISDRTQTLEALQNWFANSALECTVVQTRHDVHAKESGLEAEHGPFAGAGFVQDLELASREASKSLNAVWIGHGRSSSKLLLEWVTYRRAIRFWRDFGIDPGQLPRLSTCQLPG